MLAGPLFSGLGTVLRRCRSARDRGFAFCGSYDEVEIYTLPRNGNINAERTEPTRNDLGRRRTLQVAPQ